MEIAKLVLRCFAAIMLFAVVLGAVSAWICPESFAAGRPEGLENLAPIWQGILSRVLEFLAPSFIIGLALGNAASLGHRPAIKAFFFTKPLLIHALLMALAATVAGFAGYYAAGHGLWRISSNLPPGVFVDRLPALAGVWWAGIGGHAGNILSGIFLVIWTWRKRAVFEIMVRERNQRS
jgi:hypothetical protein